MTPAAAYAVSTEQLHHERIKDQFTKQAEQFSKASPLNDKQTLDRIISFAAAGPTDEMLDVACVVRSFVAIFFFDLCVCICMCIHCFE